MPSDLIYVSPQYQPIFREVGLDAEAIFTHDDIKPWRVLNDRENCTLDAKLHDGRPARFHIKRNLSPAVMEREVEGFKLLGQAQIPTAPLVGYGKLADSRAFVI